MVGWSIRCSRIHVRDCAFAWCALHFQTRRLPDTSASGVRATTRFASTSAGGAPHFQARSNPNASVPGVRAGAPHTQPNIKAQPGSPSHLPGACFISRHGAPPARAHRAFVVVAPSHALSARGRATSIRTLARVCARFASCKAMLRRKRATSTRTLTSPECRVSVVKRMVPSIGWCIMVQSLAGPRLGVVGCK